MKKTKETKEMEKVEVVFILDRSGSMCGLEEDTIGGFNATLKEQKQQPGEVLWSTVLFDDRHEVIHDRVPIKKVKELTPNEYYVRGSTALLDAVGRAIHHIKNVHKYARKEDIPDKTLFVITTDGYENASAEYTYKKVKDMIQTQTNKSGWEFVFLGANIDAAEVGESMGIDRKRSATFHNDSTGIMTNFKSINTILGSMRYSGTFDEEALDEIHQDYEKRKKN